MKQYILNNISKINITLVLLNIICLLIVLINPLLYIDIISILIQWLILIPMHSYILCLVIKNK